MGWNILLLSYPKTYLNWKRSLWESQYKRCSLNDHALLLFMCLVHIKSVVSLIMAPKCKKPSLLLPVLLRLLTLKFCLNLKIISPITTCFRHFFLVCLLSNLFRRAWRHCITPKLYVCMKACNPNRLYSLPSQVIPE